MFWGERHVHAATSYDRLDTGARFQRKLDCYRPTKKGINTLYIDRPGKHTLRIVCGDAGTLLQKIVLDFGGLKHSYMGPQPTRKM